MKIVLRLMHSILNEYVQVTESRNFTQRTIMGIAQNLIISFETADKDFCLISRDHFLNILDSCSS